MRTLDGAGYLAYTVRGFVRWFSHCGICGQRHVVARYHEIYTDQTWTYGCRACTRMVQDILERRREHRDRLG